MRSIPYALSLASLQDHLSNLGQCLIWQDHSFVHLIMFLLTIVCKL